MDPARALALAPAGSRVLEGTVRFEVRPDIYVDSVVIETPHSMIVVYDGRLPDGGFARGTLEVDPVTYKRAIEFGRKLGGAPVIRSLIERAAGGNIDLRRTLAR